MTISMSDSGPNVPSGTQYAISGKTDVTVKPPIMTPRVNEILVWF